ncbi:MAG: C69 family dipeptidase [Vagococcus sp.]
MERRIGSCTTLLVGKLASIDGSTMIARNEDGGDGPNPQRFQVIHPKDQPRHFKSLASGVEIELPDNPLRYTSTPDANDTYGVWAGSGINSENIAMTASETITTNSRIIGIDPFVESGIGEADFVTLVLPYIHSAKEGVIRLGHLLETYGTYESNGIAFSDKDDIWYLETIGGHHWAAIRIPDDAYVIAPNSFNIDQFDFDSEDTLYSKDLPEMIDIHHLNPDFEGVNLRHIFGSATIKDTRYNTPRAWYIQKYFNPSVHNDPNDFNLPFICRAERKISVEDVKWALSSHYENTPFDPYGTGSTIERKTYRSIGLNRNLETHILQIRDHVSNDIAGIHWLSFGPNTFNSLVPFYANVHDTPACYRDTPLEYHPNSIYWLNRTIALIGDTDFDVYGSLGETFEQKMMSTCRQIQLETDHSYQKEDTISTCLESVNQKMSDIYLKEATALLGNMVNTGASKMALRFSLAD